MLRLESIVLQGFKSFVDRTRLSFPLGISCIVGPNGCGKSNIADAIAWVLGEQSPKSLRSEKMGDVIFAGSPTRTASGHADVAMIWLREGPNKSDSERLEVGRKLYRNGDSEYILNGKNCRLKDVQSALLDFGMGTKAYSIIEQGKVGQILSSKPTERRQLLEEAAGILKYKIRRHESQLKLRSAEDNLQRLQDILHEIQKQRNYLKRQVGKAQRYKLHKSRLRELDKHIFSFDIFHFTEKQRILQSKYRQLNAEEQNATKQLLIHEEALKKKRAQAIVEDEKHKQIIRNTNETAKEIERLKQKVHFFTDKIRERNASLHATQEEKIKGIEHKKNLEEDLVLCKKDLGHVEETLKVQKTELNHLMRTLVHERKGLDTIKGQEEELRTELENHKKRFHGLEIEHTQIVRQTSLLESQLAEYDHGKKEHLEEENRLNLELRKTKDTLEQCENQIKKLEQDQKVQITFFKERTKQRDRMNSETRAAEKELHQVKNQHSNLKDLLSQRQDLSDNVRWVLKQAKGKIHLLRDFLDSSHQYDQVVELLLGDLAQAFLITNKEDHAILQPLRKQRAFSVIDLTVKPAKPLKIPFSSEMETLFRALQVSEQCPESFRKRLESSLLTLLWNRVILLLDSNSEKSIDSLALAFPHLIMATPGDVNIYQANLVKKSPKGKKNKGFLTLKGEISALKQKKSETQDLVTHLKSQLIQAETEYQTAEKQLKKTNEQLNILLRNRDRHTGQLRHTGNLLVQLKSRLDREESRVAQIMENRKQIQGRTKTIEEERTQLCKIIETLEVEWQAKSVKTKQTLEHVQEHLNQEVRLKEKIDAAGVLNARIQEEHTQLVKMYKNLEQNEANRVEQHATLSQELIDFQSALAQHQVDLTNHKKRLATEEALVQKKEIDLGAQREQTESQETHITDLRDKRDDMRAKQGRFELEQARIDSELMHLRESYALSQNESFPGIKEEELASAKEISEHKTERSEIKRKLSELGTVNLLAVEEYDEIEARYSFLISQQKDLVDAISEIRSTIKTLNKESVSRFKVAFDKINLLFQENFSTLFGGGTARLELLEEDNVLDSGIDMIIQPPGKKLQNAMLMSGGEKALTATALLFSIFEYRPSPFCVLDEVDAPLDEANVVRLAKKLEQMKEHTQFIMITHHKSTMAIASSLFGVTMEENGCSKIVSVNFN